MRNLILEKIATLFLYVMIGFALFLLLRGHNSPGGGFIAGILAASGFLMYAIVFGSEAVLKKIVVNPRYIIGTGLLLALISAIIPIFWGLPPMTAIWGTLGKILVGTPLLFDTGVFVLVTGMIISIITNIMDVLKWNS